MRNLDKVEFPLLEMDGTYAAAADQPRCDPLGRISVSASRWGGNEAVDDDRMTEQARLQVSQSDCGGLAESSANVRLAVQMGNSPPSHGAATKRLITPLSLVPTRAHGSEESKAMTGTRQYGRCARAGRSARQFTAYEPGRLLPFTRTAKG
jgi:hypothetical protein